MKAEDKFYFEDIAHRYGTEATSTILEWIDALRDQCHSISEQQFIAVCRYEGWKKMKELKNVS